MLEGVLKSRSEASCLAFFLAAPTRCFSTREVSRRLRLPGGTLTQALSRLLKAGYLRTFSKKGRRYHYLNVRHKMVPQMREYISKHNPRYRDELFLAIRKLGGLKAAYLSGIFAGHASLPVDLLLVGKPNLTRLAKFIKNLEKLMGQEINYSIMSPQEFELRRDTFDKFIKDVFDYRHLVVFDDLPKRPAQLL